MRTDMRQWLTRSRMRNLKDVIVKVILMGLILYMVLFLFEDQTSNEEASNLSNKYKAYLDRMKGARPSDDAARKLAAIVEEEKQKEKEGNKQIEEVLNHGDGGILASHFRNTPSEVIDTMLAQVPGGRDGIKKGFPHSVNAIKTLVEKFKDNYSGKFPDLSSIELAREFAKHMYDGQKQIGALPDIGHDDPFYSKQIAIGDPHEWAENRLEGLKAGLPAALQEKLKKLERVKEERSEEHHEDPPVVAGQLAQDLLQNQQQGDPLGPGQVDQRAMALQMLGARNSEDNKDDSRKQLMKAILNRNTADDHQENPNRDPNPDAVVPLRQNMAPEPPAVADHNLLLPGNDLVQSNDPLPQESISQLVPTGREALIAKLLAGGDDQGQNAKVDAARQKALNSLIGIQDKKVNAQDNEMIGAREPNGPNIINNGVQDLPAQRDIANNDAAAEDSLLHQFLLAQRGNLDIEQLKISLRHSIENKRDSEELYKKVQEFIFNSRQRNALEKAKANPELFKRIQQAQAGNQNVGEPQLGGAQQSPMQPQGAPQGAPENGGMQPPQQRQMAPQYENRAPLRVPVNGALPPRQQYPAGNNVVYDSYPDKQFMPPNARQQSMNYPQNGALGPANGAPQLRPQYRNNFVQNQYNNQPNQPGGFKKHPGDGVIDQAGGPPQLWQQHSNENNALRNSQHGPQQIDYPRGGAMEQAPGAFQPRPPYPNGDNQRMRQFDPAFQGAAPQAPGAPMGMGYPGQPPAMGMQQGRPQQPFQQPGRQFDGPPPVAQGGQGGLEGRNDQPQQAYYGANAALPGALQGGGLHRNEQVNAPNYIPQDKPNADEHVEHLGHNGVYDFQNGAQHGNSLEDTDFQDVQQPDFQQGGYEAPNNGKNAPQPVNLLGGDDSKNVAQPSHEESFQNGGAQPQGLPAHLAETYENGKIGQE